MCRMWQSKRDFFSYSLLRLKNSYKSICVVAYSMAFHFSSRNLWVNYRQDLNFHFCWMQNLSHIHTEIIQSCTKRFWRWKESHCKMGCLSPLCLEIFYGSFCLTHTHIKKCIEYQKKMHLKFKFSLSKGFIIWFFSLYINDDRWFWQCKMRTFLQKLSVLFHQIYTSFAGDTNIF